MNTSDVAGHVVSSCFGEQVTSVVPIVGKGAVNSVFIVRTQHIDVVVRLNTHHRALLDYQKEAWCIKQAIIKGIPSPNVLAFGQQNEYAYMIESFVVGENGVDAPMDKRYIWRELGRYHKVINSIPVKGFGEHLSDPCIGEFASPLHDGFDGTWAGFLDYNIVSLTDDDRLIDLGVITTSQSQTIRRVFEKLHDHHFPFGLNHGDLSLKNTVVSPDNQVFLLDWGSAEVNVAPYREFIQVMQQSIRCNTPSEEEMNSFIEGYGLSPGEFADMQPLLNVLLLLSAFDKLRWALDQSPNDIRDFATYANVIAKRLLGRTD